MSTSHPSSSPSMIPNSKSVRSAADLLYRTEADKLRRKAKAILRNEADADDAVQEAFLFFLELPELPSGNAAHYLGAIVARVCRDRLRTRSFDGVIRAASRALVKKGSDSPDA